jgi:hypothetical protein
METDMEFSRKVVPPLLRRIASSNQLNMKLGEIEGDAVFFYRFGPVPTLNDLALQCKAFYINFLKEIQKLKNDFADDYKKVISSSRLGLKIVVHSGNISTTFIEGHEKLMGEEVIEAHRLLKNSINEYEYLLLSEKFLKNYDEKNIREVFNWDTLKKGSDEYEHIGKLEYRYINLEPLFHNETNAHRT